MTSLASQDATAQAWELRDTDTKEVETVVASSRRSSTRGLVLISGLAIIAVCAGTIAGLTVTQWRNQTGVQGAFDQVKLAVTGTTNSACEGQTLKLTCPTNSVISIVSALYGRTSLSVCPTTAMYTISCAARNSGQIVHTACDGKSECSVGALNDVFGDPCFGTNKYLQVSFECIPVSTVFACENSALSLACSADSVISIASANYGRTSNKVCTSNAFATTSCRSSSSISVLQAACDGTASCRVDANNGVFGDPCFGTPKYLEVSYTCKFITKTAIACEGAGLDVRCSTGSVVSVLSSSYGRTSDKVCPSTAMYTLSCASATSASAVQSACDNQNSCHVDATNDVFGDPCFGTHKYLEVHYQCIPTSTVHVACENTALDIACPQNTLIRVQSAAYGRSDTATCPSSIYSNTNCKSSSSLSIVQNSCDGQSNCHLDANNGVFGDPCFGTFKYLQVQSICAPIVGSPKTVNACEGSGLELACGAGTTISIMSALYGRTGVTVCPAAAMYSTNCASSSSLAVVKAACAGKASCHLDATNGPFGDPCYGTNKYLEVQYACVSQ
eukprot:c2863_g1_i1.p1 GENE.c2863_g1_i1~~c2863_g1_i1.p1  ORF type:complete len:559 (+),score=103.85 c2863_g1_i1:59-1735(+)